MFFRLFCIFVLCGLTFAQSMKNLHEQEEAAALLDTDSIPFLLEAPDHLVQDKMVERREIPAETAYVNAASGARAANIFHETALHPGKSAEPGCCG